MVGGVEVVADCGKCRAEYVTADGPVCDHSQIGSLRSDWDLFFGWMVVERFVGGGVFLCIDLVAFAVVGDSHSGAEVGSPG